ncbi:MAG: hypothetical protein LAP40_20405 [Acidobacteriia bacterium]|nr:hypothetical protein [Terriglobia bacterium]
MLRKHASRILGLIAALLALTPKLPAERLTPKPHASDYPVHLKLDNLEIAADSLVHSFSRGADSFFVRGYLVFEVAFYPTQHASYRVSPSQFALRLNGKKQALYPQEPGLVAASMKHPDDGSYPGFEAGAGLGGAVATIGRPLPVPRFPGDPTGTPRQPPGTPEGAGRPDVPQPQHATAEEVLRQTALVQSEESSATSGYLFFAYSGNVKKLKSVELLYTDAAGVHVLRLP